ncbi:hypothetical protein CSC94_20545 [Zhengella mangrovi]|uniref:TRAP transporter small permease protein n=1 Tax=Zhengella mangrovi TaxID=1982044 RepID=A0A2G1QHW6_9HYPH|nr:TRAP transporter small permease [Zhengella mangrovi]PHP65112.1 hypothetical protein CSC94_20545 [Zhengella mangrovi]
MSRHETPLPARLFTGVIALANAAATAWIIFLMALIVADVVGRNVFLSPIAGVPEIVKFSIIGIVFLQIAHTHAAGQMIRSDGLLSMIIRKRPRLGHAMDAIAQATGCGLTLALAWTVWPRMIKAFERGEFEGAAGYFALPVWPFLAIIIGGSLLLSLSFAVEALRAARRAGGRLPPEGER